MDFILLMVNHLVAFGFSYITSRSELSGQASNTILAHSASGGVVSNYDQALYDSYVYASSVGREQHFPIGLKGSGRWLQATFTHQSASTDVRFQVQSLSVRGMLLDQRPRII